MAGFVAVMESGDTVIHKQLVVLVGEELYYLNNTYNWNDDDSGQAQGDIILETIKRKEA
jgi:hypothetical protein